MLINENRIFIDEELKDKDELFEFIAKKAEKECIIKDYKICISDFKEREKQISTGLQEGFAIPHCRSENVKECSIFYVRNKYPIDWETLDGSKVNNIIAILVPKYGTENQYLELIAEIATNLLEDDFKLSLNNASSKNEILKIFNREE